MTKLKLRTILFTIAAIATVLTAGAQDQRLNLSDTRMSVSNIFQQIRRQTHLGVAYRTDQINPDRMVTLPSRELTLGQAMEILTEGTDLKGVIDGNVIVFIKEAPATTPVPVASDGFVPTWKIRNLLPPFAKS